MNNCAVITCPKTDDLPSYFGEYTTQGFVYYADKLGVPGLPVGYYIPVASNPQVISAQGCQSTVTQTLPPNATQAQIQQAVIFVMTQISNQLAACNGTPVPPAPPVPTPPSVVPLNPVNPGCVISPLTFPDAVKDTPYGPVQLLLNGSITSGWTTSGGSLPTGLTIDGNGLISGTPTGDCANAFYSYFAKNGSCQSPVNINYTVPDFGPVWSDLAWDAHTSQVVAPGTGTSFTESFTPDSANGASFSTSGSISPTVGFINFGVNNTAHLKYKSAVPINCFFTYTAAQSVTPIFNGQQGVTVQIVSLGYSAPLTITPGGSSASFTLPATGDCIVQLDVLAGVGVFTTIGTSDPTVVSSSLSGSFS